MGDYSDVSRQDSTDSPLDFVVVNDKLLLQHLNSVQVVRRLLLGQHHLPEIAFSKHSQEIEIIKANFPLFCYLLLWLWLLLWWWWWPLGPLRGHLLLRRLLQWWIATTMLRWARGQGCYLIRLRWEAGRKRLLQWWLGCRRTALWGNAI